MSYRRGVYRISCELLSQIRSIYKICHVPKSWLANQNRLCLLRHISSCTRIMMKRIKSHVHTYQYKTWRRHSHRSRCRFSRLSGKQPAVWAFYADNIRKRWLLRLSAARMFLLAYQLKVERFALYLRHFTERVRIHDHRCVSTGSSHEKTRLVSSQ